MTTSALPFSLTKTENVVFNGFVMGPAPMSCSFVPRKKLNCINSRYLRAIYSLTVELVVKYFKRTCNSKWEIVLIMLLIRNRSLDQEYYSHEGDVNVVK